MHTLIMAATYGLAFYFMGYLGIALVLVIAIASIFGGSSDK